MLRPRVALVIVFLAHGLDAAAQDPVFSDGFESGDLSAWSAASADGGDLSVQSNAALAGTQYGLQAIVDDTTGVYVEDGSPADETRYRARFYFDASGFDPGEATGARRTRIFIAFQEAPTRRLMAIVLRRVSGQYAVMARVRRNDNTQADTGFYPITPGEHWIEFNWVRASTATTADGAFQLWVDGDPVASLTGIANGAGAVDFVRMGALSVKAGATGVLHWDQFASRELTLIGPSLAPGNACQAGDQCGTASCVDGVCCNAACGATCAACDLTGTVGTCTPVPAGQDVDGECPGVSCTGYYAGWLGDACRRKADVSAAQARCSGSESCRTTAQECNAQTTPSTTQVTCHADCQSPNLSSCTGTIPGSCTNVNPGNQSCGDGVCRVTVAQCAAGAPNSCVPNWAASSPESCNDIDDNCDGTVDNGISVDSGEPNNDCLSYRTLATVGSDQTLTQNTFTLYPSGDVDYYRINASETDSSCRCCDFWCLDEDYELAVTLTVPTGAGSYQFCANTACAGVSTYCQTVFAGGSATWTFPLDGGCPGDDSYSVYVRISAGNAPGYECRPYTLSYTFDALLCNGATAPDEGFAGPPSASP